jgi:hypothetical protein
MNIDSLAQSWNPAAARRAMCNLQQIPIDLGRIRPAIQPAGNLIDEPLAAIGVEPLRGDTCSPGLSLCEGGGVTPGEQPSKPTSN